MLVEAPLGGPASTEGAAIAVAMVATLCIEVRGYQELTERDLRL